MVHRSDGTVTSEVSVDGYTELHPVAGALFGETIADLEMHMAARATLMNLLMDDPDVNDLFHQWTETHPFGHAARDCREHLARMAEIAGFATTHDFLTAIEQASDGAIPAPSHVTREAEARAISAELAALAPEAHRRLDAALAAVTGIDPGPLVPGAIKLVRDTWGVPWPWIAVDLVMAWAREAGAAALGSEEVVRFAVMVDELAGPAPEISFETQPGETLEHLLLRSLTEVFAPLNEAIESARPRHGRRTSLDIVERYVGWWYRQKIRKESIRAIAGKVDDQRSLVRKGIERADRWLGAVVWSWKDQPVDREPPDVPSGSSA